MKINQFVAKSQQVDDTKPLGDLLALDFRLRLGFGEVGAAREVRSWVLSDDRSSSEAEVMDGRRRRR